MTTKTECRGGSKTYDGVLVLCSLPGGHAGDHRGVYSPQYDLVWSPLRGIDGAWEVPHLAHPELPHPSRTGGVTPTPEPEPEPEPEESNHLKVMDEARRMLDEDRYADYGDPSENFARIAALWSAYLGARLTSDQVAVMMALMKCSRLAHSPDHWDSYVDGVAYLAIAAELKEDFHG